MLGSSSLPGETLLGARFLARFLLVHFVAAHVFVQRNAIVVQLLAQPFHVFHDVMKFRIRRDARGGTRLQFIDEKRMACPTIW